MEAKLIFDQLLFSPSNIPFLFLKGHAKATFVLFYLPEFWKWKKNYSENVIPMKDHAPREKSHKMIPKSCVLSQILRYRNLLVCSWMSEFVLATYVFQKFFSNPDHFVKSNPVLTLHETEITQFCHAHCTQQFKLLMTNQILRNRIFLVFWNERPREWRYSGSLGLRWWVLGFIQDDW